MHAALFVPWRGGRTDIGFLDKIRGEFIDIIEWIDESRDTMVCRFERYENQIKMGEVAEVRTGDADVRIELK